MIAKEFLILKLSRSWETCHVCASERDYRGYHADFINPMEHIRVYKGYWGTFELKQLQNIAFSPILNESEFARI